MTQRGKGSISHVRAAPTVAEHQLLECIRHAQHQYLTDTDPRVLFNDLLNNLLALTGSGYGYIAEVYYDLEGAPYLKSLALTNIAWDKATQDFYRRHALQGLEFHKLGTLYGAVLTNQRALIANDAPRDPRRGGLPAGHPALDRFLGLPVFHDGKMIAMVGLANRAAGYDQALIDYLAPLTETIGLLVQHHRRRHHRDAIKTPLRQVREETSPMRYIARPPELHAVDGAAGTAAVAAEHMLRELAAALSAHRGDALYAALTQDLTRLLGVDIAFVALRSAEGDAAEVVALCEHGQLRAGFHYPLAGTPCAAVLDRQACFHAAGLADRFPDCVWTRDYQLDSYCAVPYADADGRILGLVAVAQRRPLRPTAALEATLRLFAARIALELGQRRTAAKMLTLVRALEQTAEAVMITDHADTVEYVNPAYTAMTGYAAEELIGRRRGQADATQPAPTATHAVRTVYINRKKGGELFYEEQTVTPLRDAAGAITHYVVTGKDVTERMQTEERLHRLVYYDALTELPNRRLFLDRLGHALARNRADGTRLAVLCFDVDHLKVINDTLGHDFGDQALRAVARLLADGCRPGDTVARLGGDEFALLIEHVAADGEVLARVCEILASASQVLHIDGQELYATLCIGVALAPADGDDAPTLLSHADAALYRAKQQGRQAYHFYSADLSTHASQRLDMDTRLRRALEREEFHLCYQPQLDLRHGRVVGVEALLRWHTPEGRLVSPEDFIPALEDSGLIVPVGEWVLRHACRHAMSWLALGSTPPRLCVNVSGRQLMQRGFLPVLRSVLVELAFPASLLELEITESVLMQDDPLTRANLGALREMGVRLAIDDFGTGYSSLGYLKRFSVEALKIDRSFVRDVTSNRDDAAIIAAIVAMAQSLNLDVIAEGIETPEQLHTLRTLGCHISQGFLFSPPVSGYGLLPLLGAAAPPG